MDLIMQAVTWARDNFSWIRDKAVSFLEEKPGIMSSRRMALVMLLAMTKECVDVIRQYVLSGNPNPAVVTAIVGGMGILVGQGVAVILSIWKGES